MDGHIQEHTAGYGNISGARRLRIPGGYADDVGISHLPVHHCLLYSSEVMVKTAVEAYLVFQAAAFQRLHHLTDSAQIMIDGLFTEYMLSGSDCLQRDRRMGVRGGTDQNSLDLGIIQNLMIILRGVLRPHLLQPLFRFLIHEGIGNGFQLCVVYKVADASGMHLADSSGSDNSYCYHKFIFSFPFMRFMNPVLQSSLLRNVLSCADGIFQRIRLCRILFRFHHHVSGIAGLFKHLENRGEIDAAVARNGERSGTDAIQEAHMLLLHLFHYLRTDIL